jgi:hypothetical protein
MSFCECVGYHIIGRTINQPNRTLFNNPSNEMKVDVDMFGMGVVLVIF